MLYAVLVVALVVLDQVVKFLVRANIPLGGDVPFLPHILQLTYVQNTGAAFSLLEEHTWILTIVSLVVSVLLTVLLGFVIERAAYKPLRSAPRMSVMISAIGVSYLLQNLATYITGGLPQMYPSLPGLSSQITIAGTSTKMVTVITPFLVVALVVVLTQLINHTKIGMAMRAASRDFETAQLMGIKINNIICSSPNSVIQFLTSISRI